MPSRCTIVLRLTGILLACLAFQAGRCQCSPLQDKPPDAINFRSGTTAPDGSDRIWKVTRDSINGVYSPAMLMKGLPSVYPHAPFWISFSSTGLHTGDHLFFFKTDFSLPCFDLCGNSFDSANVFCLNLDLFSDNSIYEIYVNGIPQSARLGNMPLANPYNPLNHTPSDKTEVSLCNDWRAGSNSLVIVVASSATVMGLLVEPTASPIPPPNAINLSDTICEGSHYAFGNLDLTQSGTYFQQFVRPGRCDSNVVLTLTVNQPVLDRETRSICEGQQYQGYSQSGIYTAHFTGSNGCDSVHELDLTVLAAPHPALPAAAGLCAGDTLLLNPGKFDTYAWQDGSSDSTMIVRSPGLYSVAVTNSCGTATASVRVSNGHCGLFFPNAFTPNGDGYNDQFRLVSDLPVTDFELRIFNRWGQLVYESRNPKAGWNGRRGQQLQPAGTYVWQCRATLNGRQQWLSGTLLLLY